VGHFNTVAQVGKKFRHVTESEGLYEPVAGPYTQPDESTTQHNKIYLYGPFHYCYMMTVKQSLLPRNDLINMYRGCGCARSNRGPV
jgi:hypothetical protein